MAAFYASEVSRHYGGPCSRDEAWRKFAVYSGHWVLRGLWFPEGFLESEISWA